MTTQQRNDDQNVLAARLQTFWQNFRQGKVIGYKVMAVFLILIAAGACVWYILIQTRAANSALWVSFQEANSVSDLEDISKKDPNTLADRLSRLQIARYQLGASGIDQLSAANPEQRRKAIENIEKARETLQTLLPEFNNDLVFKAECLYGLAKAEAALVGVPAKEGSLTEFKGSVPKVVEYLDQFAAAAPADSPWSVNAKKLADSLRNPTSASEHEFVLVERDLFKPLIGAPEGLGQSPLGPLGGISGLGPIPGVPQPSPPQPPAPKGPIIESSPQPAPAPNPKTTTPGATPGPLPPSKDQTPGTTPKAPDNIPAPVAPPAKAPETKAPTPNTAPMPQKK